MRTVIDSAILLISGAVAALATICTSGIVAVAPINPAQNTALLFVITSSLKHYFS
ncbi:hypothetical protein [Chamaesiphon sp. OTE_8_metabat_110]|uniref:hypothetical protein n=1 Tax=Chamaesiphon sp. OTE_8_metabat_110 TaxID=2964696 RepID=UPI00286A71D2|nr:hypothetical protein [Chamaesiphon sp. OTE_8_metabat_110]